MAQLYKMTLYVCDLEDRLSLDEIETLIKQDALDGISLNCVCHFADRQIGKQVEWGDDIDLNRCDCPTSAWEKYFAPPNDIPACVDSVDMKTLEAWPYEIAMNNTQNALGGACEEIIRRLNGLRTYAKEKSEESASCDIPGEPVLCETCSQWNAGNGWCKKHNKYTRADWHCAGGGA